MSLIRALSKELEARSDDSLRALFSARPDLISPNVPDFAALAARASARVSVQRALERLNRPQMQVLETLHLCTNTDTAHSASAAGLKKLIHGASLSAIERILHSLAGTGTCAPRRSPARRRAACRSPPAVLPSGGQPQGRRRDLSGRAGPQLHRAGPAAAGLRPARGAARGANCTTAVPPSTPPPRPWKRPCRCSTGRPPRSALNRILATAPDRTTALLARFGNWAMGAVPQAQRRASVLNEGSDVGPVDWLLARGLLVPLDAAHVELPHSVGISLRGGAVIEDFTLAPPVPQTGTDHGGAAPQCRPGRHRRNPSADRRTPVQRARAAARDVAERRRRGPRDEAAGRLAPDRTARAPACWWSSAPWPD